MPDLLQPQARTTHAQPKAGDIFADGFEPDPANAEYSFSYDRANRLSAITGPGLNASYQIGATGMRVAKTANGQTTHFVYSLDGQLLYEHDLSQNRRTQHIYLNGQPIALVRNNTAYWVHTDHLGRPKLITNQTGTTAWRARLFAFNRTVVTDSIGGYHLGFPGQHHDTETGFAYNIHRDYDPATGRYLQSDPIGVAGGVNTHAYAGRNPISYTDPLGLARASGAMADCLEMIFGQSVAGVNVRNKTVVRNRIVTTPKNSIRLPPTLSMDEFFADHGLVLHEYYHVLRQWSTGDLTRRGYVAEIARSGSWADGNRFEDAANGFAKDHAQALKDCLQQKSEECSK